MVAAAQPIRPAPEYPATGAFAPSAAATAATAGRRYRRVHPSIWLPSVLANITCGAAHHDGPPRAFASSAAATAAAVGSRYRRIHPSIRLPAVLSVFVRAYRAVDAYYSGCACANLSDLAAT
jgi:hypothetical protein